MGASAFTLAVILQAAAPPAAAPASAPDIQLDIHVAARRVAIESRGTTSLTVRTSVNGNEGRGNVVDVQAPSLPQGQRELREVDVRVRAEGRIPDPASQAPPEEPRSTQ